MGDNEDDDGDGATGDGIRRRWRRRCQRCDGRWDKTTMATTMAVDGNDNEVDGDGATGDDDGDGAMGDYNDG